MQVSAVAPFFHFARIYKKGRLLVYAGFKKDFYSPYPFAFFAEIIINKGRVLG